jgi:hypothetical protein
MASDFDLEMLLDPTPAETFLADSWEKQPVEVHRNKPAHYADLFSLADVDAIVAFTRPRFADASGFPGGPPASQRCVQGCLPDQLQIPDGFYPNIAELRRAYGQGKTVVIRGMQHRWPAIASLCRNLEAIFQCPVHGNLYLTPPNAQGFDAHIDPHEVFALQLAGVKHWQLYGQVARYPLVGDTAIIPKERLGPRREVRLEPGDLLYLPRGHAHEAATSEHPSLHLTVGVNIYRWADLLHKAVDEMSRRDERLRKSLPPRALLADSISPLISQQFHDALSAFAQSVSVEAAIRRLGSAFLESLAVLPRSGFAFASGIDSLGPDTILVKNPGAISCCRIDPEGALIQFPGGQVCGPARIASALQFVARSERFAVRELPDSLGEEGKLILARRLIREGLLDIDSNDKNAAAQAGVNGTAKGFKKALAAV